MIDLKPGKFWVEELVVSNVVIFDSPPPPGDLVTLFYNYQHGLVSRDLVLRALGLDPEEGVG